MSMTTLRNLYAVVHIQPQMCDDSSPEAFDISHDGFMSVGAHRLTGEPTALILGKRLFSFVDRTTTCRRGQVPERFTVVVDCGGLRSEVAGDGHRGRWSGRM